MSDDDKARKDMLICRCEEVSLGDIEKAIDEGFDTLDDIKRLTRAGMGLCQGRSCGKVIARIIAEKTGKSLEEILQTSYRFPVRPEKLKVLEGEETENA